MNFSYLNLIGILLILVLNGITLAFGPQTEESQTIQLGRQEKPQAKRRKLSCCEKDSDCDKTLYCDLDWHTDQCQEKGVCSKGK